MTLQGMTTERLPDGTVILTSPLVQRYAGVSVEAPEPLHGNDKRMIQRRASVHDALRSVRAK